jgi:hypothetical protein
MDIFVTNKNDFYHEYMYNGDKYQFPQGERVVVPDAAASHMLGFNKPDKTETLVRLGWANLNDDEGVKRLAKFVFTRGVLVEEPAENAV